MKSDFTYTKLAIEITAPCQTYILLVMRKDIIYMTEGRKSEKLTTKLFIYNSLYLS